MPRVLTPEQKERHRAAGKKYYEAHKDEVLARKRVRLATPAGAEAVKAAQKKYHEANKAKRNDARKKHYAENKASTLDAKKKYYEAHKAETLATIKKWRDANIERYRAARAKLYARNSDYIQAQRVIKSVTGLLVKDIPKEMLEVQTMQVKILRALKCR
jgi:hypothetical protein